MADAYLGRTSNSSFEEDFFGTSGDLREMKLGLYPNSDTSPIRKSRLSTAVKALTRNEPNNPELTKRMIEPTGRLVNFESSEILMPSQTSMVGTFEVLDLVGRNLA